MEQRIENKNSMNIQIVEQTGLSLKSMFQRPNPFKDQNCGKSDCLTCDGTGVKCRTEGVGYTGICKECRKSNIPNEYKGISGKNAYTTGKQRLRALKSKNEKNAL